MCGLEAVDTTRGMGAAWAARAAWGWGAAGALACAAMAMLEPNVLEEGLPLHVAQRLLRGDQLYRDVVLFTGPLPFEALALLFRAFGEHLFVARGTVVAVQGLATAAIFALARRAGCGAFAHVAAGVQAAGPILAFPLFSIYFATTLASLLATLAVYAGLRGVGSRRWGFAAGLLAAGVALCKQTAGVALAPPLVAAVALYARPGRRLAAAGAVAAGGLAAAVATLAVFAARGTLGELVRSLVTMPLAMHETFRTPLPAFWPPGELGDDVWRLWPHYLPRIWVMAIENAPHFDYVRAAGLPTQILYASPFAALAVTLARGALGRLPAAAALHAAAVLASTVGLFPRSDWGHLSMVLCAAWAQIVLVGAGRAPAWPRLRRALAGTALAGLALVTLASAAFYHALAAPRPWDPRVPVRAVSDPYRTEAVPRVIDYLRARTGPGDPLFVARQEPLLYFVTGTRNPTRYEGMMQGMRERQEAEVIEALAGVRYVAMSEIDGRATGFYAQELPAVAAYLERHFRIPADFDLDREQWLVVYERAADRGETAIDLYDAAPSAHFWVRNTAGDVEPFPVDELPLAGLRHLRRPLPIPVWGTGGGVDFELEVPSRGRFEGDLGIFAVETTRGPFTPRFGATYRVSVLRAGEAEVLDAIWVPDDPRGKATWRPFVADLSRWAGERLVLRLEVVPRKARYNRLLFGWWGSPRIVSAPAAPPLADASAAAPEAP